MRSLQVEQMMASRTERVQAVDQPAVDQPAAVRGEYVRCRLALLKLQRDDAVDVTSDGVRLGLLFPGADSVPVRQRPALLRTIQEQLARLQAKLAAEPGGSASGTAGLKPGTAAWADALSELAGGELRKLFTEVEVRWGQRHDPLITAATGLPQTSDLTWAPSPSFLPDQDAVVDVHALEQVVRHLSGRRKHQQLALKEKNRAKGRVRALWEQLISWSSVPGAVSGELKPLGRRA